MLTLVYLVFNEGYLASAGRAPARRDLAARAVSLTRLLHRLMPHQPEVLGLLALLLLHESRAATRFDGCGRLVRLQDQDRTRWDGTLVAEATALLDRAVATRFAIVPAAALVETDALVDELEGYRLFHAVRADLLHALDRHDEARVADERAPMLAANPAERELLTRRLML